MIHPARDEAATSMEYYGQDCREVMTRVVDRENMAIEAFEEIRQM
jgi:hypothetical protein